MSLFKKKDSSFEDMDSQSKLNRISEQLGFLEKKVDTLLEELRTRGGSRPSFGGPPRDNRSFGANRGGGFRGGSRPPQRYSSGNTRYAGQGPQRYNPSRPLGGDDNRGNYSGPRREGGHRHEGGPRREQGGRPFRSRRPHQQNDQAPSSVQAPAAQTPATEAQPE